MRQVTVQVGGVLSGSLRTVIQPQVALLGELPLDFVVARLRFVTLVVWVEGTEAVDILALGSVEAVFIAIILKANPNNVPTIFHAREIMRRQAERLRARHDTFRQKMTGRK